MISASTETKDKLSLFVPIAANSTNKPLIETVFTEKLINRAFERGFRIAEIRSSDLIVKTEIRSFDISSSSYSSDDRIMLFKARLILHLVVLNRKGERLIDEIFDETGDFPVNPKLSMQQGGEMAIASELSVKTSDRIIKHIINLRRQTP